MAEEKKDRTITVDGKELELREPRGRNGRRATNWLLQSVSGGKEDTSTEDFLKLVENEEFLEVHMKAFLAEEDAKFVDDHATVGELLGIIMAVVEDVFESFSTPEVDAALKNSPAAQEEEGE